MKTIGNKDFMIKNIDFDRVNLIDGFWQKRFELNAEKSIYAVQRVFEESGRFKAVRFDKDNKEIHIFYDSDVAKWMEGVAYLLAHDRKRFADLEEFCDQLIDCMVKNQREDGYFNSYFLQVEPEKIFTDRNLHELYCAGHLIEAAIVYHKYTGKRKFLDFAERMAMCIYNVFYVERSANFVTCGHEEIELALFLLYEYTKKTEYKTLGEFFINQRGNNELDKKRQILSLKNAQEDVPARELTLAEGHAVRATYFYCGMADMARISSDKELKAACERLFEDIAKRKMFVTGGIGSVRIGEAFTTRYDLPNISAYSESCAAIGLILFALRMQELGVDAIYGDVIEKVLYNGFLSSTSLDGKSFFYENTLEVCRKEIDKEVGVPVDRRTVLPPYRRQEVFSCSCCPPNINRFVASIERVIYTQTEEGIYVNQFIGSKTKDDTICVETNYPIENSVNIYSGNYPYKKLFVRIPSWCEEYEFTIDGKTVKPQMVKGGYAQFDVESSFDIHLEMEIEPIFIMANPQVRADAGKVCLMRGPVVYCLEEVDNGQDLFALAVNASKPNFTKEYSVEYNLPIIYCDGQRTYADKSNSLYAKSYPVNDVRLKFIPYYCFANREESDMLVWVDKI